MFDDKFERRCKPTMSTWSSDSVADSLFRDCTCKDNYELIALLPKPLQLHETKYKVTEILDQLQHNYHLT